MEQTNRNKILITGATGFVGNALCKELTARDFEIRLLVRDPTRPEFKTESAKAHMVVGDLQNNESLNLACADQQIVIHLAGIAHVNNGNFGESRRSIVDGTKNLLAAAIKNHVKRFVYVSSSLAQVAKSGTGAITHYGSLKKAAEDLLLEANSNGLIEVVILRPVNVYGVGMQGNIAAMISMIARRRLPPLPVLNTRISLVGVADLARALRLAISAEQAIGKTYIVTDGQQYRITEIEAAIYAALDRRFPRWRTPHMVLFAAALIAGFMARFMAGHQGKGSAIGLRTYRNITHDNLFDNSAISLELGFQPSTTLYKELPEIVAKISRSN